MCNNKFSSYILNLTVTRSVSQSVSQSASQLSNVAVHSLWRSRLPNVVAHILPIPALGITRFY